MQLHAPADAKPSATRTEPTAPELVVVIPTFNERDNIRTLIPEVLAQDAEIEVLVVDDRATSKIPTTSGGYGRWFDRDAVAERLGCLPCTN